ncbi:Uncharacterized protein DBV15_08574 [Temnothorax longispinosus]|uniref:Uncharacterized protein n=1 Tax=Temnothorax longispinosus TaxID=300112 RepID=A0A4V3SC44_9HYME|nr:Uncharacterized protein DBV15_08574 [Temnothorax longispinosus]
MLPLQQAMLLQIKTAGNPNAASTPYGTSSAVQLNGGYTGYTGYYGPHHHQVHAVHASLHSHHHAVGALAMPPEAQPPPLTCPSSIQSQQQQQQQQQPSVPTSTILGSTPLSPSIMQNHVQQPDALQHHQHENNACSPAGSGQLHRDNSPDLQTQQSLSQQSQHIQSGQQQTPPQQQQQHHVEDSSDADDIEDSQMDGSPGMMEEEEEDDESRDRTIYPWMKKIHVAGVDLKVYLYESVAYENFFSECERPAESICLYFLGIHITLCVYKVTSFRTVSEELWAEIYPNTLRSPARCSGTTFYRIRLALLPQKFLLHFTSENVMVITACKYFY